MYEKNDVKQMRNMKKEIGQMQAQTGNNIIFQERGREDFYRFRLSGTCEHGDEPLHNYQILMKDFTPWSYCVTKLTCK